MTPPPPSDDSRESLVALVSSPKLLSRATQCETHRDERPLEMGEDRSCSLPRSKFTIAPGEALPGPVEGDDGQAPAYLVASFWYR